MNNERIKELLEKKGKPTNAIMDCLKDFFEKPNLDLDKNETLFALSCLRGAMAWLLADRFQDPEELERFGRYEADSLLEFVKFEQKIKAEENER